MIKTQKSGIKVSALSLLIIAAAIVPILIVSGGNFWYIGDYMTQQIPFMRECRRMFLSGTPYWSSNTFLGANFIGTYSFYVYGSPFFWPLVALPEKFMGIGISVMFVLKHVVAALTAHLYLKSHTKTEHFAVIGALMYAFSGFTLDSVYYYHFLDVIAFFPLILYFTDKALDKKKEILLSLSVLLCAVTNYYFFVSTSVFFLIYLVFRTVYGENYKLRDAVRCVIFYGIGGLASAAVMLPSALELLETSKATESFSTALVSALLTIPQIIKILKGILLPSEGILGAANGFTYSVFTSTAAFLPFFGALFLFTALRKKSRQWDYRLIKFLFILTLVPFGNGLFSFFTNMNYTRWWYALVLIMAEVSIHILDEMKDTPELAEKEYKKSAKIIGIISSVILVGPVVIKILCAYLLNDFVLEHFPAVIMQTVNASGILEKFDYDDLRYCIVFIIMAAASYGTLYVFIKKGWMYTAKKVVPAVVIISMLSCGLYLCNESGRFTGDGQLKVTEVCDTAGTDSVEYTSRTDFRRSYANYAMIANEPSIYTFHSFKSHQTAEFCRIAGYGVGSMPTTNAYFNTPAIQSVLSISSVVDKSGTRTEAPYYVPFGQVYRYYVPDEGIEFTKDKEENNSRIQTMTKACYLDSETAEKLSSVVEPLEGSFDWKQECAVQRETACTDFVMKSDGFTAVSEGKGERLVYFGIPNDKGWEAFVNGSEAEIYSINGGLIGIVVPDGRSEIEFKFTVPGLAAGEIISAVCILGLAVYAVIKKKSERIDTVN